MDHKLPQIFNGASNSRRMGCERNISLDLMQRLRISCSASCTAFPGRAPRTVTLEHRRMDYNRGNSPLGFAFLAKSTMKSLPSSNRDMILSTFNLSPSAIPEV